MKQADPAGTLASLIQKVMKKYLTTIKVSMPCEIISYDQGSQTATIKPLIRSEGSEAVPIEDVPAIGQRLMINGYETYCPPIYHRGDKVLVVFSDREFKGILQGSTDEPQYARQHSIMDGVIVGVFM